MRTAEQWDDEIRTFRLFPRTDQLHLSSADFIRGVQREAIAACRAAVEKQLIHGALSLQGKTAVEQADAVLAAIDAVEVR